MGLGDRFRNVVHGAKQRMKTKSAEAKEKKEKDKPIRSTPKKACKECTHSKSASPDRSSSRRSIKENSQRSKRTPKKDRTLDSSCKSSSRSNKLRRSSDISPRRALKAWRKFKREKLKETDDEDSDSSNPDCSGKSDKKKSSNRDRPPQRHPDAKPKPVFQRQMPTGGKAGSTDLRKWRIDQLAQHNQYRYNHGVSHLIYSPEIEKFSQAWAEQMAAECRMYHSTEKFGKFTYGENCAVGWHEGQAEWGFTKLWYDEVKDYNFNKQGFNVKTGHFTQVIWKSSKRVAFGLAIGRNGYAYGVANYDPPGNVVGQFERNVPDIHGSYHVQKIEALRVINDFRKLHGAPEITFSQELNDQCQACAEAFKDSKGQLDWGQWVEYIVDSDILKGVTTALTARYAVKEKYNFAANCGKGAESFVTIVWKDAKHCGIGYMEIDDCGYLVWQIAPPPQMWDSRSILANVHV